MAMIDRQPFAAGDLQPVRIEPQQLEDRGVDIGDVMPVFHGVESQFVGCAMGNSAAHSSACHPD